MSDEAALLTAIAAHPDEDTPRLMYADWLQENGRAIRAEFIRLQIEIAQIDHLPRAVLNRYVHLFERNQELIDNHRAELLGPLSKLPAGMGIEFRRGFVQQVTVSANSFWYFAPFISAYLPRPRVTVADLTDRVRQFLGVQPSTENLELTELVTSIRTTSERAITDPFVLEVFEALPLHFRLRHWPNLEELDTSGCELGDDYANLLFRAPDFPALFDLDTSANNLTDAAVDSLLVSGLPQQLKRLILGGNDISDIGAVALAERWPTGDADRLEHLNLRFTNIGQVGQAALLRRFGGRVDLF